MLQNQIIAAPRTDTALKEMATKVLTCLIVFALLALFSVECEANGSAASRPPGKVFFQRKDSIPVSKVILKKIYT